MHMQITAGLRRLGHDVYYVEATSVWPYDPIRQMKVNDSDYAVPYLARVAENFGLGDRWAYRRRYSDKEWFGLSLFSTCGNESYVVCLARSRKRSSITWEVVETMIERKFIDEKAQDFFEDLWKQSDYWKFETSDFEQAKYARQLEILDERRYPRVLVGSTVVSPTGARRAVHGAN